MSLAVATGIVLTGLIFGTLFTSKPAFFVLVAAAVLIAQWELYHALAQRGYRPATELGVAAGGLLLFGAYHRGPSALSFATAMTVLGMLLWFLVEPRRTSIADDVGATLFGILYVPFLAAHVVMMSTMSLPDRHIGGAVTIAYIGLVAFYDIGAFTAGMLFGKRPMAPSISPKKTWEGAVGATVVVFVIALLVGPLIDPFDAGSSAALALVVVVLAPLGDLAESLIKRDLAIKDMGGILPGHGGALDRVDALLLVAPAAYWLTRAMLL